MCKCLIILDSEFPVRRRCPLKIVRLLGSFWLSSASMPPASIASHCKLHTDMMHLSQTEGSPIRMTAVQVIASPGSMKCIQNSERHVPGCQVEASHHSMNRMLI